MSEQVVPIREADEIKNGVLSERIIIDFAFKSDVVGRLAEVMHSLAFEENYDNWDAYNEILNVVEFITENTPMPGLLRKSR